VIEDVDDDRDPAKRRDHFPQQVDPFAHGVGVLRRQAGGIAPQPWQACYQSAADRVRDDGENNRNCRGRLLDRNRGFSSPGDAALTTRRQEP
jgi:hypothetical protein